MAISSRLLQRLDQAIAGASDPILAGSWRVQRAVLLARHGRMAEAREALTALHQLAFQHPHPILGAWLHYAEGLMSYFSDFGSAAGDKIRRAQAMAQMAGLRQLEALCAAWLAHIAYVQHDVALVAHQAQTCLRLAGEAQHDARSRLAVALGLAYDFAGRLETAQAWYGLARRHAAAEGDDATQSALIYNMIEVRCARQRRESLAHPARPVPELLLGADSVKHYDAAVGGSAMSELTPVLRAQILVVQGDYAQAQALYEAYLPQAMALGLARLGSSLLADLAWCRVNLGQREQALRQAQEAEFELDPACDVDDRAATHSRLAQVYGALGDASAAERHAALAAAEWAEFERQQAHWAATLDTAGLGRP
ncbi:MAG: hypothetical protein ACK4S6_20110 [Roseateles asaccharophilus]|uniref:Tetratricopeptide repeat protein n=1 Tax=Roseateles asaccharophilus TaxID=582607 RepID=A0A4R6MVB4_9BURK|nr:hypothetical protein [Roseateles asaccharophilus]MDN3544298.1 hypothetical protein [Roseateles asaccharophilus]TDP06379.1 hypothetical protein DFR39_10952 [Roseateles asaccharophilus]